MVTGAARGLGAAIARGLFDRGCRVVFVDIDGAENEKTARAVDPAGEKTQVLETDVSDLQSVEAAFQSTIARWGRIDILVNNAAVARATSLWDIAQDEWDHVIGVNLRSVFFLSRLAGKHMRDNGYGRIVNIASLAGQMARPSGAHYAASKGGILALTRVFAAELAASGVTVNAVAPAILDTPMVQIVGAEKLAQLANNVPVKRIGRPEEVAALVCFLASPDAGYVTGATYDINGGMVMR
jgi:3-oxoacyl-[acyl-carrier protein] reductase